MSLREMYAEDDRRWKRRGAVICIVGLIFAFLAQMIWGI